MVHPHWPARRPSPLNSGQLNEVESAEEPEDELHSFGVGGGLRVVGDRVFSSTVRSIASVLANRCINGLRNEENVMPLNIVHSAIAGLAIVGLPCAAFSQVPSVPGPVSFHYDDLDRFDAVLNSIGNGGDPAEVFLEYMEHGSAGFRGWMGRYDVSADEFGSLYREYGSAFHAMHGIAGPLREEEEAIRASIENLRDLAQSDIAIPVYYFVSSQYRFAGTPVQLEGDPAGVGVGAAIGVSERFEEGAGVVETDGIVDALGYLAVHEASHILQLHAQGGLQNYRSIYAPGGGTMLSIALREGCAEYLTYLASGERYGDRHLYVAEHEAELWSDFLAIADEPAFSVVGWFGGADPDHPDRPFQIGYAVGSEMCRAYHEEMDDPDTNADALFALFNGSHAEAAADAYSRAIDARSE